MQILLIGIIGIFAQLVDGSLGMAYGVSSTTLLVSTGLITAAVASATVHISELGTTLVSGISHHKFGNVDWRVVKIVGIPGAIGSFLGATVLAKISTEFATPWTSTILLCLGVYVLIRFSFLTVPPPDPRHLRKRFLIPLGLIAGFFDATGGGGWGPIGTPTLLATGKLPKNKVVGSIDTSEFLVALAAVLGFVISLKGQHIDIVKTVLPLLIGGIIAAPFAAFIVKIMPARIFGSFAGGLIIWTNIRTLIRLNSSWKDSAVERNVLIVSAVIWAIVIIESIVRYKKEQKKAN
jgi:uncharacterized membrane protein YfcA